MGSCITIQPVKVGGRWQVERDAPDATASSGTRFVFTRKGIEVTGWFDHICATGDGWNLSWEEVEEIRNALLPQQRTGRNPHMDGG